MKNLRDFDFADKKVLVRCDFNVPLNSMGNILNDFKIVQTLPTIEYLKEQRAKIILMSHLGDPAGRVVPELKLDKVAKKLSSYLNLTVTKTQDCVGPQTQEVIEKLSPGEIVLLENLRFHGEEEAGNLDFAEKLAGLAEVFVNDAFAVCHRPHASLMVAKFLKSAAGLLLEKEIKILTVLRENPTKPLIVILGGKAKAIEIKLDLINRMSQTADFILLGNLISDELAVKGLKFDFPERVIRPLDSTGDGRDIGPDTLILFKGKISQAATVFWSGPLGQVERKEWAEGSVEMAKSIIESKAFSVVGGGDTVAFLDRLGLREKFNHVSSGGDALLLFLAGSPLPGIDFLG